MEIVLRVFVIYVFLLIGMRVIGKREFSQLSAHEFVILLIIPEMVSTALNQNDRSLTNAIVGVTTILSLVFLTSLLSHRFPRVENLISGAEAVLVHKGKLMEDVCNKERITPGEIISEARKAGVEKIEDIRWAILESDGQIAVIAEQQKSGARNKNDVT